MSDSRIHLTLTQQADFRFETHFDNAALPALVTDEPPPLGQDAGPNPARLLLLSVANCLSASLLFALRKFKAEPGPLSTRASASLQRNEQGRMRVAQIEVEIHLGVPAAGLPQLDRALAQFEDFCVVTQSVRAAVPVAVRVHDSSGALLKG